ncbi:MAG: tetratricopeptide repeat protein [Gammaproteobacteria bacterium]
MVFQTEDRTRARRQHAEAAIQLALNGRWAEAVQLNQSIIDSFPADVDAYNRLGKAQTELGRYGEARDAYMKALEIDSVNSIARKNLDRLATLGETAPPRAASQKLSPQMFIEETGKTGVTVLRRPNRDVAARMTAGDQVALTRQNGALIIQSQSGDYVGEVEPKLAQRLIKLMEGGNEYIAAIAALARDEVRVFIRETFQHGSQTGKLSFPPTVTESFRPYTKSRLLRQEVDEDTYYDEGDEGEEWSRDGGTVEDGDEEMITYGFGGGSKAALDTDTDRDIRVTDEDEEE